QYCSGMTAAIRPSADMETASMAYGVVAATSARVAFAPGPAIPVVPIAVAAVARMASISCRVAFTPVVSRASAADVLIDGRGVPHVGSGPVVVVSGAEVQPAARTRAIRSSGIECRVFIHHILKRRY